MKTTPWIIAATLALGLSPAVQAQYRDSYRHNDSYSRWDGQRTYALAHEVDQTASFVYREAYRYNRRPNRGEVRTLQALHQLNEAASHFHDEVESYRQDPRHTANDFARLVAAYDDASTALQWFHPRETVVRGMDRIADLIGEMSPFYGRTYDRYHGRGRDGDRRDRYDRNDRGRYDDRNDRGRYDRNRDPNDNGDYRPPVR